jgi:hypothetical protein
MNWMTKEEEKVWNTQIEHWPCVSEEYIGVKRNKATGLYDLRSNFKCMWKIFNNSYTHKTMPFFTPT